MKYIYKFYVDTPYCGTNDEYTMSFDHKLSDIEAGEMLEDYVYEKAESFAYLRTGWNGEFEDEDSWEMWLEDCFESSSWELVEESN